MFPSPSSASVVLNPLLTSYVKSPSRLFNIFIEPVGDDDEAAPPGLFLFVIRFDYSILCFLHFLDRIVMNCTNLTTCRDNFSCYSTSVEGYRYFAVTWGCAMTIIGTVGNLMTFLAFALQPHLRTRFNMLILNLSLVDLLSCSILYPVSVDAYLHLRWRSGQLWCNIFSMVFFLLNAVSIGTLCLIAGARYLMVAKRAVFDRVFSKLGLSLLIISQWALGLVTHGPLWHANRFDQKMCVCTINHEIYHPYPIILFTFYFLGGLICVGTFYFLIYRHVRKSTQALRRHRFSPRRSRKRPASLVRDTIDSGIESSTTNTCGCETSSQNEIDSERSSQSAQSSAAAESATESHSEVITTSPSPTPALANVSSSPPRSTASGEDEEKTHVAVMCLAVLLGFVFCFVPFMLMMLLGAVDKCSHVPQVFYMFCLNISWISSCINPVLYAVMNRQFRQAYIVLLTRAAAPFTCLWVSGRDSST